MKPYFHLCKYFNCGPVYVRSTLATQGKRNIGSIPTSLFACLQHFKAQCSLTVCQIANQPLLTCTLYTVHMQDGGFYSAEDADSFPEEGDQQKKEGAFCVWKDAEIWSILSEKLVSDSSKTLADLFCFHYGVKASGNVSPSQLQTHVSPTYQLYHVPEGC